MTALIILNICTVIGFFAVLYKLDQSHSKERQDLYQRIQAPQQAIVAAAPKSDKHPLKTYVDPDSDEDWREYLDELSQELS